MIRCNIHRFVGTVRRVVADVGSLCRRAIRPIAESERMQELDRGKRPAKLADANQARALAKIERLQLQIAGAHKGFLEDLVDMAQRTGENFNGRVPVNPHAVAVRLAKLRQYVNGAMRSLMLDLIYDGNHNARNVLLAAMLHSTRRHTEAEGDEERQTSWNWDDFEGGPAPEPRPFGPVADMFLPAMSREESLAILFSRNSEGMTWEQQLDRSSHQIADPLSMVTALAQGTEEGDGLREMRERIMPLVNNLSVSAQRIARTEGFRLLNTSQQRSYDKSDVILEKVGRGFLGMTLHCSMMSTSAKDHKARNGRFYKKIAPGKYQHEQTGEMYPNPPFGHPNCSCFGTPELPSIPFAKESPYG